MQPTSSGGIRHPDASEFSEHPIKEVPEVSLKPLGLLLWDVGEDMNYNLLRDVSVALTLRAK